MSLVVGLCHDKLLEFNKASCRCCTLVTLELRYRRRSLHGSRPVAEAGRTANPARATVVESPAAGKLVATNSFSSQWFHGNVCRSVTINHRRYCHNCCASLSTNLGSTSIVFILKYVEVFPCRVENTQQDPRCPC